MSVPFPQRQELSSGELSFAKRAAIALLLTAPNRSADEDLESLDRALAIAIKLQEQKQAAVS